MTVSTFETPDGDEIEIDGDDVVGVKVGKESDTTIVELEDGDEIVVAAGKLEVIAELDLDPLLHDDPDEDVEDPDDTLGDRDD
ncbi:MULTISPECIES: hypothetical protein [unclassified Novosphingobium]|jgi:hypothetical protein|uniref:hypothetical protein n=1 Tax=unclassified Novosphingobium TaxID=2644732 RepID=UPI0013599D6D|nr:MULTISPECIES: hypothetical protein [unclassified Novosphingobium]